MYWLCGRDTHWCRRSCSWSDHRWRCHWWLEPGSCKSPLCCGANHDSPGFESTHSSSRSPWRSYSSLAATPSLRWQCRLWLAEQGSIGTHLEAPALQSHSSTCLSPKSYRLVDRVLARSLAPSSSKLYPKAPRRWSVTASLGRYQFQQSWLML